MPPDSLDDLLVFPPSRRATPSHRAWGQRLQECLMKQEMLINVAQPEECRIALVEDNTLEELYIERTSQDNFVGNIYKEVVVNLEPSIQAAFVDFGVGRNGFLHISDVEPQYFRQGGYNPEDPLDGNSHHARRAEADFGDDEEEEEGNGGGGNGDSGRGPQTRTRKRRRMGGRPRVKP